MTDPVNEFYEGLDLKHFNKLRNAKIPVVVTNVKRLRDSNPIYTSFWRTFIQWFGAYKGFDWLPNPLDFDSEGVGIFSYLRSLNFKANHRKVVLADNLVDGERKFSVLVTSANPHDGSSAHSNSALKVDEFVWKDVLESEKAVFEFSGADFINPPQELLDLIKENQKDENIKTKIEVQLLTEKAIRDSLLESINDLEKGDKLDMAMFYLADRKVVKALKNASQRGVKIRLFLDASKDAFGRKKNGMPNRQVASELRKFSDGEIEIRWCHTHGEQCHSKMTLMKSKRGYEMFIGSANLTKRNLDNLNLETNLRVFSSEQVEAIDDAEQFFNLTFENEDDKIYSVDYDYYADESWFMKVRYRIKEFLGTSRW